MKIKIHKNALLIYVKRNSGLTATQYASAFKAKWGTMSSKLYRLCKTGELYRLMGKGTRSNIPAWRYYKSI